MNASEAAPTAGEEGAPDCTCPPDDPNAHYSTCPLWRWTVRRGVRAPATPPADGAATYAGLTASDWTVLRRGSGDQVKAWLAARESAAATRARAEAEMLWAHIDSLRHEYEAKAVNPTARFVRASDVLDSLPVRAASIARSDAAPHTGGQPVNWDSPTWGGGVHHATTDDLGDHGRHSDETEQ